MQKFNFSKAMNPGVLRIKGVRDKIVKAMMIAKKVKQSIVYNKHGKPYLKVYFLKTKTRWLIKSVADNGFFFVPTKEARVDRAIKKMDEM